MSRSLLETYDSETKLRESFLPFALPDIGEHEHALVREVLDSGWLTTGPKTHQFESEFAEYVGANHAVAVNSCTAALHLALEAESLQPGDLVITTPYTFAATAEVIRYFDAIPLFVDVDPKTLNIDAGKLEECVAALKGNVRSKAAMLPPVMRDSPNGSDDKVKAIIPVHIAGLPCELEAIYAIAERFDLAVIEDTAHAFPVKYQGKTIGGSHWGMRQRAACFSFYPTKTLTTGEGGMICTPDAELAGRCRTMALHGISKDAWKRYTAEGSWFYEIIAPGFKYNMGDLAAALGLAQLRKAEPMRHRRAEIAAKYNAVFGEMPELETPQCDEEHAWHLYMLRLHSDKLRIGRAEFIRELNRRNIGVSVHFIPLHIHPYYREKYAYEPQDFPVSYQEYEREISLPIYSKMTDADVDCVIDMTADIVEKNRNG